MYDGSMIYDVCMHDVSLYVIHASCILCMTHVSMIEICMKSMIDIHHDLCVQKYPDTPPPTKLCLFMV